jgi:hypothetical protein
LPRPRTLRSIFRNSVTPVLPIARDPTPAAGDGPGPRTRRNVFQLDQWEPVKPEGIVVDDAPLPGSVCKEHERVHEALSCGEGIGESFKTS